MKRFGRTKRVTITLLVEGEWPALERLVAREEERNVSAVLGRLVVDADARLAKRDAKKAAEAPRAVSPKAKRKAKS